MNLNRFPVVGVGMGGLLLLLGGLVVVGCSGPQPLPVAMRESDRSAYAAALRQSASTPKQAFFDMRAEQMGLSREEVARRDQALSATRNPFDANSDPAAVSMGAVVYRAHCMRCHGEDARGNGPALLASHPCKDFHALGKRFAVTLHKGAPRTWFRKINEGYGDVVAYPDGESTAMPAFGDALAREQIWLAITYLQSLDAYASPPEG